MGIKYATREEVKSSLDINTSVRDGQIDRAIDSSSRSVEQLTNRKFYPQVDTRYFDWPSEDFGTRPWRLWLDADEIISLASITSGGIAISTGTVLLYPPNSGPPYTSLELNRSSSSAFGSGSTSQRSIAVTGVYGFCNDSEYRTTATAAIDSSSTTYSVANSSALGIGDLLLVETEYMVVTGKSWVDTTQTATIDGNKGTTTLSVGDGSTFFVGETILLDSERMLITDVVGNNLLVKRAVEGTVLSTHTGAQVYAPRALTVIRGALGTTPAAHSSNLSLYAHMVPGPVKSLVIAESLSQLQQELSGYGRVVGSGDNQREASGKGLGDLRKVVYDGYARKARIRVV